MNEETLFCRMSVMPPPSAIAEFMVMPAGTHTINVIQGTKPISKTVLIDRGAAKALQEQLLAVNSRSPQRAFFDFDHADGEASGWPLEFLWRDGSSPGVYCRTEWSAAGAEAIKGKSYRAFSPVFHVDKNNPAHVAGRPNADLNMGGLVNDPAFEKILPLWAKQANPPAEQHQNQSTTMTDQELAALKAKLQILETELAGLKAKASSENADAIKAKEIEAKYLTLQIAAGEKDEKILSLESAIKAQRDKDADEAIKAAVARGAIPAQDEALKAKWKKLIVDDPANEVLLAGQAGNAALETGRVTISGVRITRDDSVSVLNAYGAEKDPRKRAAIYAKEIKPRLKEGDDLPLQAANSIGTLAGTLVTQRTLELLKLTFPVLTRITTDFSDVPANYNQTVNTRIISIPSVQTYNTTTGWTSSDVTSSDVNITIDKHKGVPITFDANTLASTVRRLFDEFAPAAAYALAKDMVDSLYALILAANFTQTATISALVNFARSTVIDMGTALNIRGVPMGAANRTLLLPSDYYGNLAKDSAIVTLAAFQKSEIITAGMLPDVHGFSIADAPNLPANAEHLVGFGFSRSALAIAARLPNDYTSVLPGASYGNVTTVTDPDLGLSVVQTQYVDHKLGTANQRIAFMYGVAVGQDKAGQRLTSQ